MFAAAFVVSRFLSALPSVTLPDGKQVIIQAVTYGTNHTVLHGSETLGKIQQHLPITRRWFAPVFALRMPTSEESLVLHFSVYDPAKSEYLSVKLERFSVIDEHGCTFIRNHWGSSHGNQRFSVTSVRMPVFPRRQKSFTVRMKLANYPAIDFNVKNPVPPNTNEWTPEPLPATRQTNDLTVTLTKLIVRKEDSYAAPFHDIYENGTNRNSWYGVSRTFRDATGNTSGTFLCLHERAWKLELELRRRPHPESPSPTVQPVRVEFLVAPPASD